MEWEGRERIDSGVGVEGKERNEEVERERERERR